MIINCTSEIAIMLCCAIMSGLASNPALAMKLCDRRCLAWRVTNVKCPSSMRPHEEAWSSRWWEQTFANMELTDWPWQETPDWVWCAWGPWILVYSFCSPAHIQAELNILNKPKATRATGSCISNDALYVVTLLKAHDIIRFRPWAGGLAAAVCLYLKFLHQHAQTSFSLHLFKTRQN